MTIAVGAHFDLGIVVLADSRVTLEDPCARADSFHDILQKILPFAPNVAVAFAGNVACAAFILSKLNDLLRGNPDLPNVAIAGPVLGTELHRLHQEFEAKQRRRVDVGFILAGFAPAATELAAGYLFSYRSPIFAPERIYHGFDVLGTGDVTRSYLTGNWGVLLTLQPPDIKTKADWLNANLEEELRRHRLLTVGGLFQIVLIEPGGIRPMSYGYFSVNPDDDDEAFEMFMKNGFWYQRNLKSGGIVRLERPGQLRLQPARVRDLLPMPDVDDAEYASERARTALFLNYFVLCGGVRREPGIVEFNPTVSMTASPSFPAEVDLIIPLSSRAGTGSHTLRLQLVDNDGRAENVYEEVFNSHTPIDDIIRDLRLQLVFPHPGVWFIEALVDGYRIARRSYVMTVMLDELRDSTVKLEDHPNLLEQQVERLTLQQMKGVDPVLASGECKSILNYFVPCQENRVDPMSLSFTGMFDLVCTSHFPQALRIMLASSLRTEPGRHKVRVDLVDVITKERKTANSLNDLQSNAYLRDTPIQGETIIVFPRQGVYALEQYVDDELSARAIIAADDVNNPKFIRLLEADQERVRQGELLVIVKGAQQALEIGLPRIDKPASGVQVS